MSAEPRSGEAQVVGVGPHDKVRKDDRLWRETRASAAKRATRTERADGAARERACKGVRGAQPLGVMMTRERFEQLVAEALDGIPRRFRGAMKNVAVVVEDVPPPHILEEMEIEPPDSLFGLYQ